MGTFTCITCRIRFNIDESNDIKKAADLQKVHFQSEWHRYNLKRKIAELPPITAEAFEEKQLLFKQEEQEEVKSEPIYCSVCRKTFSSKKSFKSHVTSKKHRIASSNNDVVKDGDLSKKMASSLVLNKPAKNEEGRSAKDDEEIIEEEIVSDDDEWIGEALLAEECLFCSNKSKDMERNIDHMTKNHSFFIPDIEYLIDLEGLVTYLGEKVGKFHMCLWCNDKGRVFYETRAVQQHMVTKGHCKVFHEGDAVLEYSDFYDYRKSYPDYKEKSNIVADNDKDKQEEEEEVDLSAATIQAEGFQLVLPSGATAGHRTLALYYKQKLRPNRAVILHNDSSAINKLICQYKGLGWTGTLGVCAQRKAKDIEYVERMRARQYTNLGIKANKLQRHFRDPNMGF